MNRFLIKKCGSIGVAVAVAGLLAGCGSSSDPPPAVDPAPPDFEFLSEYQFSVQGVGEGLWIGVSTDLPALKPARDIELQGVRILPREPKEFGPPVSGVEGRYACETDDADSVRCVLQTVSRDSGVTIEDIGLLTDDLSALGLAGLDTTVDVYEELTFRQDMDVPETGELMINTPKQEIIVVPFLTGEEQTRYQAEVRFGALEGCEVDVNTSVTVNGSVRSRGTCFTYEQFEDLRDASGLTDFQDWAGFRLAGTANQGLAFMAGVQPELVITMLNLIDEEALEAGKGSVTYPCEMFPAGWSLNGLLPQGDLQVQWLDDEPDGKVGPGDSFRIQFNQCLLPPDEDYSTVFEGVVELVSWNRKIEDGRLTAIGFEGNTAGKPGGVYFRDFAVLEIDNETQKPEMALVILSGPDGQYNGYSILFSEPEDTTR